MPTKKEEIVVAFLSDGEAEKLLRTEDVNGRVTRRGLSFHQVVCEIRGQSLLVQGAHGEFVQLSVR